MSVESSLYILDTRSLSKIQLINTPCQLSSNSSFRREVFISKVKNIFLQCLLQMLYLEKSLYYPRLLVVSIGSSTVVFIQTVYILSYYKWYKVCGILSHSLCSVFFFLLSPSFSVFRKESLVAQAALKLTMKPKITLNS